MGKKVMLIGSSGSGKTTLIQRLQNMPLQYDKTQVAEYIGNYIDTPGEYMQYRWFLNSLTILSHDAEIVAFVQDAGDENCWLSAGIASIFSKPVIGIITKSDSATADIVRAKRYLEHAGVRRFFVTSAVEEIGIKELWQEFA